MSAGVDRVMAKLRSHAQAAMDAGRLAARAKGEQVAAVARGFAPKDDGDLARSIRVEDTATISTKSGPTEFIGVLIKAGDSTTMVGSDSGKKFQNARLQEFGTANMPANPFFFPAWRLNRRSARSAIARAINKAWRGGK